MTCDRVAFIRAGKVIEVRAMAEFEKSNGEMGSARGCIPEGVLAGLSEWAATVHLSGPQLFLKLHDASFAPRVVNYLVENSVEIFEFTSRRVSLEDRFMEILGIDDGL